jgi:cyclopropane fatty-acyl-phospholipid synthase-like methyltransferase
MGLNRIDIRREAETYYLRNRNAELTTYDPVMEALEGLPVTNVLEVGSGNGARLARIRDAYGANVEGIEASLTAVADAQRRGIATRSGIVPTDMDQFFPRNYDVVIVGFLMYLLPRSAMFALAAEVDRVTADGGHVVVRDFLYPRPERKPYAHDPSLEVFKSDPSSPWAWSPSYTLTRRVQEVGGDPQDWVTVDVLRKHGWLT